MKGTSDQLGKKSLNTYNVNSFFILHFVLGISKNIAIVYGTRSIY